MSTVSMVDTDSLDEADAKDSKEGLGERVGDVATVVSAGAESGDALYAASACAISVGAFS